MDTRLVLLICLLSFASCSIIIPEELPSLLSVAYSNIPPIKKGTDSRVGFGFAFGNHADFQVLLELGPQTNTLNLTGQSFPTNTKRQAPNVAPEKINKNKEKFFQTDAGKYLQNWAQRMKNQKPTKKPIKEDFVNLEESMVELVKNDKGEYEIHQPKPDNMPKYVLDNLKKLYGEKKEEAIKMTEQKRSEEEIKKITEDLSNVDLD
ncbi:uncharacterized protein LOC126974608 [Leptidea sinapis]|uniref:Uncharacterized protein n=1 Tax=Leptidea sinapis TaxID=189913 RepID=A0A5E4QH60_9NEOP|nr:uncharacterized protein LOC126974608 [Leptidea sinapis]VVC96371.1 unnamed protein product [Leptidea sinapis]